MQIERVFLTGLRILAVCLLFTVSMAVGLYLSGLTHLAPQPASGNTFLPLLIFALSVGIVVSYLILRSAWHGSMLALAMFVGIYGIMTVVSQVDSIFLLSNKMGPGMLRAIFLQGAMGTALFAPLAVVLLGKWATPAVVPPAPAPLAPASAAWRVALLVTAFVFLYMFFGYYVAWQNPELRNYYGGPDWPTFFAALKGNW
jgi:hypothetical protein